MSWMEAAGLALQVYGTYERHEAAEKSEKRAKETEHLNAQASEEQAQLIERQIQRRLQVLKDELHQVVGAQKATYSKAGVQISSGTPRAMVRETIHQSELDAIAIKDQADTEASRLHTMADIHRVRGKWAAEEYEYQQAATLVEGIGLLLDERSPYYYRYIG